MKLFMVGAALKAKLEMLLKLLSFHLQLKFFAIAAIGLIVNIARFWLDVKKGQAPQKVTLTKLETTWSDKFSLKIEWLVETSIFYWPLLMLILYEISSIYSFTKRWFPKKKLFVTAQLFKK